MSHSARAQLIVRNLACIVAFATSFACGSEPADTGQVESTIRCNDADCRTVEEAATPAPAASICPRTCGDFCPMALACTLPAGCTNPGCRCPEGNCSDPGPVCPTTCGDFCAQSQACTLPKGCGNPGCRCAEGNC